MDSITRNKKLEKLYHSIGLKHNMSGEDVKNIIESVYEFSKERINELDLKEVKTEEEFNDLKTNFIFKYLGKLHTSYKMIEARKKQSETFKQINKKKWQK